MLNNISTNSYIEGNSFFHKLHPFIKIISILLFLFLSIYCNHLLSHLFIITVLSIFLLLSKIPYQYYLKSIFSLKYFFLFLFLFNLFFTNITNNIISILRLIEILLYSKMILYTTKVSAMNKGLTTLCAPFKIIKINPLFLSMSITLTIRFIPIVLNEINLFIKSLRTKGIYFNKNIKENIIIVQKIIVPIFTRSLNKADIIASMMEVKGFHFDQKRSTYFNYKITLKDILFIILLVIISFLIIRSEVI